MFIYKNRYTPLNTVTYWLVSLFVTFEINFGSNSLEGLHLVISRFAHAQMFYPSIDTNNWSRSVPRMVHAWKHLQFNKKKYFDTDYNLTPLQAFRIFVKNWPHSYHGQINKKSSAQVSYSKGNGFQLLSSTN